MIFTSAFFMQPTKSVAETCTFLLKEAINSPQRIPSLQVSSQKCPLIADLVFWIGTRKDKENVSFQQMVHFLNHHPDWPHSHSLQKAGEKNLNPEVPQALILSFFSKNPPLTFQGRVYYVQALLRKNNVAQAHKVIRDTWTATSLTAGEQGQFLERFSQNLTLQDHESRLNYLLWEQNIEEAKQMLSKVSEPLRRQASVWIAFLENDPSVVTKYAALPSSLQIQEGLYLAYVGYLKKAKAFDEAIKILLDYKGPVTQPIAWWKERNYLAREMLQINNYDLAYQLIQNHGLVSAKEYAEAEWFSGWLSLSFLRNPEQAKAHFLKFQEVVKTPISIARAGYWLGRTHEELKDPEMAQKFYKEASRHKTTFYGQLASHKIKQSPFPTFHDAPPVNPQTKQAFEKKELVQIIRLLATAGPSAHPYIRQFLGALAKKATSSSEKQLTIALAAELHPYAAADIDRSLGDTSGIVLKAAYPVLSVPSSSHKPEEDALVMAIIHRETRFDTSAVGDAGERGLMQIMPQTAVLEAKTLGISHSAGRLFEPKYNMKLGMAHLVRHLATFNNSYILGVAAYNAGDTAVSRWINEMGNPHQGEFDVADWIERIPYSGTRDYVQRVLENITIYRARLGQKVRHIAHDLRGR